MRYLFIPFIVFSILFIIYMISTILTLTNFYFEKIYKEISSTLVKSSPIPINPPRVAPDVLTTVNPLLQSLAPVVVILIVILLIAHVRKR